MSTLLFVYGTLKRGCHNHRQLAGQTLLGETCTLPGFRLVDLGGYPGIVTDPAGGKVEGEVWRVDQEALRRLDAFEGTDLGLYRRDRIALADAFADQTVEAYFPGGDVTGRPPVGGCWRE